MNFSKGSRMKLKLEKTVELILKKITNVERRVLFIGQGLDRIKQQEGLLFSEGWAFDDVLLVPNYSNVLPKEVDTKTQLTRELNINIPFTASPMDTVTESATSISMARAGGIGFIHRNLTIEQQVHEVRQVKKSESGMIVDPITVRPNNTVGEVLEIMEENGISGVPVTENGKKLVGIVTNRDLRFEVCMEKPVWDVMTKENLVTVPEKISLDESKALFQKHRIEKLLVVDSNHRLTGLITIKDIEKVKQFPNACKDHLGRLRVGAAIGVGKDMNDRVEALLNAEVDVVIIDSSHGNSKNVIDATRSLKQKHGDSLQLIAGNIATANGAEELIAAGADGLRVGIGPGSICTTRIIAGVGVPQITAIMNCRSIANKKYVPFIADGGIKFSGDITKAIAAGAHSVMLGSLLAGTEESPGEKIFYQGRSYKVYRGMGSLEAMQQGSKDRYHQEGSSADKLVPEGIVGRVPYRGTIMENILQLIGGLKSGMGYTGCRNIEELRNYKKFIKITGAGLKESHVHDVEITKEAPNYQRS